MNPPRKRPGRKQAKGAASKNSPRRCQDYARQDKAVQLRAEGWAVDRIASELGYANAANCVRAIDAALRRRATRESATVRAEIVARIEAVLAKNIAAAMLDPLALLAQGESDLRAMKAADIVMKAREQVLRADARLAKILGLESPLRVEASGAGGGPLELDVRGILAALQKLDPERLAEVEQSLGRGP